MTISYWINEKWEYYKTLPFPIQIVSVMQYSLYVSITIFYTYLSLPNPLFDSNNKIFNGSYVHPISWVFVLIFAIYVRLRIPLFAEVDKIARLEGSKYTEYYQWIYNLLLSFLVVCFAMGITEFSWDITITYYWYSHNMMSGITISNFVLTYAYFLTGMAIVGGLLAKVNNHFRYIWLIPLIFGLYHIVWLADGFHITTMKGYLFNIDSNLWELGHWSLVPIAFGILLKKVK